MGLEKIRNFITNATAELLYSGYTRLFQIFVNFQNNQM